MQPANASCSRRCRLRRSDRAAWPACCSTLTTTTSRASARWSLKGELVNEDGALIFKAIEFVTANGRPGTDQMAHGGAPLHMFAFYRLGRRKAKEYLAKRAQPWPPIPFAEIGRKVLAEDDPPVEDA